mgnify:CR=1 FL=1
MEPKSPRESEVTLAQMMLPIDANTRGNIHGGTIMKLADSAGGAAAMRHARQRVVTVAVESMTFLHPVHVGDLVSVRARIIWTGRTSLEAEIRVDAERPETGTMRHISTGYLSFVAVDAEGKPTAVPPLALETEEDRQRWDAAAARRTRHRTAQARTS